MSVERLASAFAHLVLDELGPVVSAEVDRANAALIANPLYTRNPFPSLHGDCDSHNHCDPNEIFQIAFEGVYGRELDASDADDQLLLNLAWDQCWARGFAVLGRPS